MCYAGIPERDHQKALSTGKKRRQAVDTSDGSQTTLHGQAGRSNKRCKLGPTEQLRVVVRQILAGANLAYVPYSSAILICLTVSALLVCLTHLPSSSA